MRTRVTTQTHTHTIHREKLWIKLNYFRASNGPLTHPALAEGEPFTRSLMDFPLVQNRAGPGVKQPVSQPVAVGGEQSWIYEGIENKLNELWLWFEWVLNLKFLFLHLQKQYLGGGGKGGRFFWAGVLSGRSF